MQCRVLGLLLLVLAVVSVHAEDAISLWTVSQTGGAMHVAWEVSTSWTDQHSLNDISGFQVLLNDSEVAAVDPTTRAYDLYGLTNNTFYSVQVIGALTDNLNPLTSNVLVAETSNQSPPGAVGTPSSTASGGGYIRVQVVPPLDTGGTPLTTVTVAALSTTDYKITENVTAFNPAAPEVTVYGLVAKTEYIVTVRFSNTGGYVGSGSTPVSVSTQDLQPPGPCPPPTLLEVTGGSVILRLNPPVDTGGGLIRGYTIYISVNGSEPYEEALISMDFPDPSVIEIRRLGGVDGALLKPKSQYDFKAIAINTMDVCLSSAPSTLDLDAVDALSVTTDEASLPSAPPSPIFLSATGGQVAVHLLMPSNMKGAILTGFVIQLDSSTERSVETSTDAFFVIEGLDALSDHSVRTAAITDLGVTGWSVPIVVSTTESSPPVPPTGMAVSEITSSTAVVSWNEPSDLGGSPINEYRVLLSSQFGTERKSSIATSLKLSNLVANTGYTVKVTSVNLAGRESSSAGIISTGFMTLDTTLPMVPTNIVAISQSGGAIEVGWDAPMETGGVTRDELIYNVTMFSIEQCHYSTSDGSSPCLSCNVIRQSGSDKYALASEPSPCDVPSDSCPDGSTSCCVTKINTSGAEEVCGRIGSQTRYRVAVGSTVTIFTALNHSSTYYVGVEAINHLGPSGFSTITGLRTSAQTSPSYPNSPRYIGGTGGSVQLNWNPPLDSGGSLVAGYHVYRDYQLVTPQPVTPPFTDCGGLLASKQYVYGISAVNASAIEGSMASLLVVTPSVALAALPSTKLASRTISSLNITVSSTCDSGGADDVTYQFILRRGGVIVNSGYFVCCNLVLTGLEPSQEYQASVCVVNSAGFSEWVDNLYSTTTGIPSAPSMTIIRANTFSLVLHLDAGSADREILSYRIQIFLLEQLVDETTVSCDAIVGSGQRACPESIRVENLSPNTEYRIAARAVGPLGSSDWSSTTLLTTSEAVGTIEWSVREYFTSSSGKINATLRRVGGTRGAVSVVVDTTQPDSVVLSCSCENAYGCSCSLYHASSAIASRPGQLTFLDGQANQSVIVTMWDDDSILTEPMSAIMSLKGADSIIGSQADALIHISRSQRPGFPSFTQSRISVMENQSFAEVEVIRVNGSSGTLTFDLETFGISALPAKHFVPISSTMTFTDGQSQASVWIRLIDNMYYEGERSFGVRLRLSSSSLFVNGSVTTLRIDVIEDDDSSHRLPGVPTQFHAQGRTGGEIDLAWSPSTTTNVAASGYIVHASTPATGSDFFGLFNVTATRFVLSSLASSMLYRVQVASWNSYGTGDYTDPLLVLTTAPSAPSAPLDFQASESGSSFIKLTWEPPRDVGGLNVTGYVLWMDSQDGVSHILVANVSDTAKSFMVDNLSASMAYTFAIGAATSGFPATRDAQMAILTALTAEATLPQAPQRVELMKPPTAGALTFRIEWPSDTGGIPITDYSLYLRKTFNYTVEELDAMDQPPAEELFQVVCNNAVASPQTTGYSSCTVYKLLADTIYEVYAQLYNAVGASSLGPRAMFRTSATLQLPSSPQNFRASRVTAGLVELAWDLPLDLGGTADVLGYLVFQKVSPLSESYFTVYDGQDSLAQSVVIKPLTQSTVYVFTIVTLTPTSFCGNPSAQNRGAMLTVTSLDSSPLSSPGTPYLVGRTGGSITVGWMEPDDLAGVPLVGYDIAVFDEDKGSFQVLSSELLSPTTMTYVHFGLTAQTVYQYTITAWNQDGPSEPSAVGHLSTSIPTKPDVIRNLHSPEAHGGRIKLVWDDPLDIGGRQIDHYEIVRTDDDSHSNAQTFFAFELSFTDRIGLHAQTSYVYAVRAMNGVFLGDAVSTRASTTAASLPDALVFAWVVPRGGRIEVSWRQPDDTGGWPIVEYAVSLLDATGSSAVGSFRANATACVFGSLQANTEYVLSGYPINAVGEGSVTTYSTFTGPPDPPSTPPAPTATSIRGGSVVISVSWPSYTGGDDNVQLVLYQGLTIVRTFSSGEVAASVYGLVAQTQYRFHVEASNSGGNSVGSDLVIQTTEISTPGQVLSIAETDVSFDRLRIQWDPVEDTGGDPDLQYEITYYKTSDGPTNSQVFVTSTTTSLLLGLDSTSQYCVSVKAITSSGLAGLSSPTAYFSTEAPDPGRIETEFIELPVREDVAAAVVPVRRLNGSFGDSTFTFQTLDESAIAGVNYEAQSGSLTLDSGVKSNTISIVLINDATYNPNITFIVQVYDIRTDSTTQTRVILMDDGDAGFFSFESRSNQFLENVGEVKFRVVRSGGLSPVAIVKPFIFNASLAVADRFVINEATLTFDEGVSSMDMTLYITGDDTFQYWSDSVTIGLSVLEGGAWLGAISMMNVTALDDGDLSVPKECTSLRLVSATGGAMQLQWAPPVDRGGADVVLTYLIEFAVDQATVLSVEALAEVATVYGLDSSTQYQVTVRAANPKGIGLPDRAISMSTTSATRATEPRNIQSLAISSSSLVITWKVPLDIGGSTVVEYKIWNVSESGTRAAFPQVACSIPTQCTLSGLKALTDYKIQVQAMTALAGEGTLLAVTTFTTSTPSIPDPPPLAKVTWKSAGAMKIQMFDPMNVGGSSIVGYRLFFRRPYENEFSLIYQGMNSSFTVSRLDYKNVYEIKYQVVNLVDASEFGPVVREETLEKSLPSAPLSVALISRTGGAIAMSWSEPFDIGGRPITGYLVMVKSNSTSLIVGYDGKGDPTSQGVVYDLIADTEYTAWVIALTEMSNCFDNNERVRSEPFVMSTLSPTLPALPPSLILARFTGGLVELQWTKPKDTGGVPVTVYVLSMVSLAGESVVIYHGLDTSFVHTDLSESTLYMYAIEAQTTVGSSPRSETLNVKTSIVTAPSPPLNVTQLSYLTGGATEIGWDQPIDAGGQPILSYSVYRDGVLLVQNLKASTRSFIDKAGLVASTSYQYRVRAFSQSSLGSELSVTLTAATSAATRPQPPSITGATISASYIIVNWAADSDTGGLPVALYDAQMLQSTKVVGSYTGVATTYKFTGLSAQTEYKFILKVYTAVGTSDVLTTNFMTISAIYPDAPPAPLVVSVFGGNFTVELTKPLDTGGLPVNMFRLYERTLGRLATVTFYSEKTRYTVTGVAKESTYSVTATAVSLFFEGPASPATIIRTGALNAPGKITVAPVILSVAGTTVTISWAEPPDTGGSSASLAYSVRATPSTGAEVVAPSLTKSATISGLKYSTQYAISVKALNSVGQGDWSPTVSVTTQPDAAGDFSFQLSAVGVMENATQVGLVITRTNGLSGQITVSFAVDLARSTATIAKDYALASGSSKTTGTVVFQSLQTQATLNVLIINDSEYEAVDEFFILQLTGVTGPAKIGANPSVKVTILDDGDAGYLSFDAPSYSVLESAKFVNLTVLRQGGSNGEIRVSFNFNDYTATTDLDYRRVSGTTTMATGVTSASIRVPILNNNIFEFPDEIFGVQMVISGGALPNRTSVNVTILDDGDKSVPGTPPPLVFKSATGGTATFDALLPPHNGSTNGLLTAYVLRVTRASETTQFVLPVTRVITVGYLSALTSYTIVIAANNSIGLGAFSTSIAFATTDPSLPGVVADIHSVPSSGGRIFLAWSPPMDSGGVPVTKYRVYILSSTGLPMIAEEILEPRSNASITQFRVDMSPNSEVMYLNAGTTYRFTVQAGNSVLVPLLANGWGAIGTSVNISTPDASLPGPTEILKAAFADATGGAITIAWKEPFDKGGATIRGYRVIGRNSTTPFMILKDEPSNPSRITVVAPLRASSWYEMFVVANNSVAPTPLDGDFTCPTGSSTLQTSRDVSKSILTGTVIAIQQYVFVIDDMARATKNTLPLSWPHPGSNVVRQRAAMIGQLDGQYANLSTAAASAPDVPPVPEAVNASGGAITIRIESPDDTGGVPITGFTVLMNGRVIDNGNFKSEMVPATDLKKTMVFRIGHLQPETEYVISVKAINSVSVCMFGKSLASTNAMFSTSTISAPEAPSINPLYLTGGGMTLQLMNPLDDGGHEITRYLLYFTPESTLEWQLVYNGSRPRATIPGLDPSLPFQLQLTVSNGFFYSPNSTIITVKTTDKSAPGPCSEPLLVNATGGMVKVNWTLPIDNGGAEVTDFIVTIVKASDGSGKQLAAFNNSVHETSFYGLAPETAYTVSVQGKNDFGLGPPGDPATVSTTKDTLPLGPIAVKILSATGGAVRILFNEPQDLGGTPRAAMLYRIFVDNALVKTVDYSEIQNSIGASGGGRRLSSSPSGVLVTGLDPNGLYNIQVMPVNRVDSGSLSSGSPAQTTAPTAPSELQDVFVGSATGASIRLLWFPPEDSGGLPLGEYVVQLAKFQSTSYIEVCRTLFTNCVITGLKPLTPYSTYVTVSNAVGESRSAVITASTTTTSQPGQPGKVQVVSVSHDTIECSWKAPLDDGGLPIIDYTLTIADVSLGGSQTHVTTSTSFVFSSLTPSTEYSITVVARTQYPESSKPSAPQRLTTAQAANAPANPIVTCVAPDTVDLVWYAYPGATQYRLYQNGNAVYTGSFLGFTDTQDIYENLDYTYTLEVEVSGNWNGVLSSQVVAHTLTVAPDVQSSTCRSAFGTIQALNYQPNTVKTWLISPTRQFVRLTLTITTFDLECDHDLLYLEDPADQSTLWVGGCLRNGKFVYQADTDIRVRFTSDATIQGSGFQLSYEVDGGSADEVPTQIPPPIDRNGRACFGHGIRSNRGQCVCSVGFTGEGCNNHIVCCSDPSRCYHKVCSRPSQNVIVVSDEFGDDVHGNGAMMNANEYGTASKAVKSLSRALQLVPEGGVIFMYPGQYKGTLNRDLHLNVHTVAVQSLKSYAWTILDCESAARALTVSGSQLSIEGLTIRNGVVTSGGGGTLLVSASSVVDLNDVIISGSQAVTSGGAIAAQGSTVKLTASSVVGSKAATGGGIHAEDSEIVLSESNITTSQAVSGAGISLIGQSTLIATGQSAIQNCAATEKGGGVLVQGVVKTSGIIVQSNQAVEGGGFAIVAGSTLTAENIVVSNNAATDSGGAFHMLGLVNIHGTANQVLKNDAAVAGGGMFIKGEVTFTFDGDLGFLLEENTAASGAGLYVIDSALDLAGMNIHWGGALESGGGASLINSNAHFGLVNFKSNSAVAGGGGMDVINSHIEFDRQVVISNNRADHGAGLRLDQAVVVGNSMLSLLWNTAKGGGGGVDISGTTTLSGLFISASVAGKGGGISIADAAVELSDIKITYCTADDGGALHIETSIVTSSNVSISDTSASQGGGVYSMGKSTITGSLSVYESRAGKGGGFAVIDTLVTSGLNITSCTAQQGGGMYLADASVAMDASELAQCFAFTGGGGIYAETSALTLNSILLMQNEAGLTGGGIMTDGSTVTHDNVTIQQCHAEIGGGVYLLGSKMEPSAVQVTPSYLFNNSAKDSGGNAALDGASLVVALYCEEGQVQGTGAGGGIWVLRQAHATIQNCTVTKNSANQGGGIGVDADATCKLLTTQVSDNAAQYGGGVALLSSTVYHQDLLVERNKAVGGGGGMYIQGNSQVLPVDKSTNQLAMVRGNLVGHVAVFSDVSKGANILLATDSTATMVQLSVQRGYAEFGAGIYLNSQSSLIMSDSIFYDNHAATSGGAIYSAEASVVALDHCELHENTAVNTGGAIRCEGTEKAKRASLMIVDTVLQHNSVKNYGGAIALSFADVSILRGTMLTNFAKSIGGGAIAAIKSASIDIQDSTFNGNVITKDELTTKGGTLLLADGSSASIVNTTMICDETAMLARAGGVIYAEGVTSSLFIKNSSLANGQSFSGGGIFTFGAKTIVENSTFSFGYSFEFGGGIYADSTVLELRGVTFKRNFAFYDGGGLYVRGSSQVSISECAFSQNSVQDGGGAVMLAPGGGINASIFRTTFQGNNNFGLGSAINVGRKNTLNVVQSLLLENGDLTGEGGGLYAADAVVNVDDTQFIGNIAKKGAAIELSRDTKLTARGCRFMNNLVDGPGGAFYLSVRAVATVIDTVFLDNMATTGGAIFALGSATLSMKQVTAGGNRADRFGGWIAALGSASVAVKECDVSWNEASFGGAISLSENAVLSVSVSSFAANNATYFGGAVYIDSQLTKETNKINVADVVFANNSAVSGADVYWVYHPSFEFECRGCTSHSAKTGAIHIATSAVSITAGWWPNSVTSGVSLGIPKPKQNSTSGGVTSAAPSAQLFEFPRRRLDNATDTTNAALNWDPTLTSPYTDMLWPTMVVYDYYNQLASYDVKPKCSAAKMDTEKELFVFYSTSDVTTSQGYITFTDASVLATSRIAPFQLNVTCALSDEIQRQMTIDIIVKPCLPGYQNVEGRCLPCKKGMYSLDGYRCYLCPLGATCEEKDLLGSMVGSSNPTLNNGYFVYDSRASVQENNCLDRSKWAADDPCRSIPMPPNFPSTLDLNYIIDTCARNTSKERKQALFDKYWPRKRIYACLSQLEVYQCDTQDACTGGDKATKEVAQNLKTQCKAGYGNVMCATCKSGYYKVSNGKCNPCSDPKDPAVERMTRLIAMIPIGFGTIAFVLVVCYFSNSTETEILRQARAARRYQVYDATARRANILLAAKFYVQQRVHEMARTVRARLVRRRKPNLFRIEPRATPIPAFRPEKFKIMLAFFQIFGGFKKLYEIPWPNEMSRLMDLFSIADFSLVDTTGVECFIRKDYFSSYRLSVSAVLILLCLIALLLVWGVLRYRVRLAALPRHCVRCGLPVFKMYRHKPQTLIRRATLVSMLRIENENRRERLRRRSFSSRAKGIIRSRTEASLRVVTTWWSKTRMGKALAWLVHLTRMPASSSEHRPTCPTTHRIESEVLAMVVRSNIRLWRARIRLRLNYRTFQNKCTKLLFWVLLLFYPELSQRVIGVFYCDEIGKKFYMSRDKSQYCFEGLWLYYLPLTIGLLVFWVAGVPLLFWSTIFLRRREGVDDQIIVLQDPSHFALKQRLLLEMREDLMTRGIHIDEEKFKAFESDMMVEYLRNKKLNEPSMIAQVGFIYHSYKAEFWWFEVWDLGRKLFLNCVIGLLAKTGANRIIAGLIIFLIYLSIMLFYKPYKDPSDSALAGVTQIQLFITLFCGLILKMGSVQLPPSVVSMLTYVTFSSNILTMVFAVFSIIYEKFDAIRKTRRRIREEHRRALRQHVRRLWWKAYGFAFTEVYLRDTTIRPMPVQVIVELARRDRETRRAEALDTQLRRTSYVGPPDEDNHSVMLHEVGLELPRPVMVSSARASSIRASEASAEPNQHDKKDEVEEVSIGESHESNQAEENSEPST